MTTTELILEILEQYSKAFGGGVPKTKLLKLAYLVEVKYKRRFMERITNANWIYYLYGPYLREYDSILINDNINIANKNFEHKNMEIISLNDGCGSNNAAWEIKTFIGSIVRDYGKMELKDLLDYVYFETEPMIDAESRNETLNFDSILPEEYYKVKELKIDPKIEKQIRQELRKKAEALRGKRAQ